VFYVPTSLKVITVKILRIAMGGDFGLLEKGRNLKVSQQITTAATR